MQQKTLPKCIRLQTAEGDHLGFMLIAIADDALSGKCVFIGVPQKPSLFDSPVARALWARRSVGESEIEFSRGESLSIRVRSPDLPNLTLELDGAGTGTWREAAPGSAGGLALAAAPA